MGKNNGKKKKLLPITNVFELKERKRERKKAAHLNVEDIDINFIHSKGRGMT